MHGDVKAGLLLFDETPFHIKLRETCLQDLLVFHAK